MIRTGEPYKFCDRCNKTHAPRQTTCLTCGSTLRELADIGLPVVLNEKQPKKRVKIGTGDIAKYPFLEEAGDFVRQLNVDIWNDSEAMEPILERSKRRLRIALHGEVDEELADHRTELLTFISCLVITKMMRIDKFGKKYALMEARRVESLLVKDLKHDNTTMPLVIQILENQFGLHVVQERLINGALFYRMTITDYLVRSTKMQSEHWKLVNEVVHGGHVYLDEYKVIRLLRGDVQSLILDKLNQLKLPQDLHVFQKVADELRAEFQPKFESRIAIVSEFPPCVQHIAKALNEGVNITHTGRVFLAAYMAAIGKSEDEIVEAFRNAPDFKESITRYQVHGLLKKKETIPSGFAVTGCEKLKNANLCFANQKCEGIRNPMNYGRIRD